MCLARGGLLTFSVNSYMQLLYVCSYTNILPISMHNYCVGVANLDLALEGWSIFMSPLRDNGHCNLRGGATDVVTTVSISMCNYCLSYMPW